VVSPGTVVRWHRAGFRLYWRLISRVRKPVGRRPVTEEIRELIFQMVAENPTWRAPRIHGELVMLGFEVSERSVSRWMRHAPRTPDSAQRWLTFLRNHREAIAAMDFFSVPTIAFGVLYCFFIIGSALDWCPRPVVVVARSRELYTASSVASITARKRGTRRGIEIVRSDFLPITLSVIWR